MDKIGRQTLICGDVIEVLKKIPDKSVSLIVTDPPYNLNKDYGKSNDLLEFNDYIGLAKIVF